MPCMHMRKTRAKQISGHPINASTLCTCVHADAWELLRCARASCTGAALPGLLSKTIIHLHAPALLGRLLHGRPAARIAAWNSVCHPNASFTYPPDPVLAGCLQQIHLMLIFQLSGQKAVGSKPEFENLNLQPATCLLLTHSRLFGPGTRVLSGTSVRAQAPYAHGSGTRVRLWT